MSSKKEFVENQKFKKPALDAILVGIMVLFAYGYVQQEFFGKTFGTQPIASSGLLGGFLVVLVLFIFVKINRLMVKIDEVGIYYQIFPLPLSKRFFTWDEIEHLKIRTYDAAKEYGGYGYRRGLFNKGRALIFAGTIGLEFQARGSTILLGTQHSKELQQVLSELGKL